MNMNQQSIYSLNSNEMHEEESSPTDNENIPYLKRNTPILFSTNRGLHLRTASSTTALTPYTRSSTPHNITNISITNSIYNMIFCDLERWNTNRANNISLEDTFRTPKSVDLTRSLANNSFRL